MGLTSVHDLVLLPEIRQAPQHLQGGGAGGRRGGLWGGLSSGQVFGPDQSGHGVWDSLGTRFQEGDSGIPAGGSDASLTCSHPTAQR